MQVESEKVYFLIEWYVHPCGINVNFDINNFVPIFLTEIISTSITCMHMHHRRS